MSLKQRFMRAFHGGANASEMDHILMQLTLERAIRRKAKELATLDINPRNLTLAHDLVKAAAELLE